MLNIRNIKSSFRIVFSLRSLKEKIEKTLHSDNEMLRIQAQQALDIFARNPMLAKGVETIDEITAHRNDIESLMSLMFPAVLSDEDMKGVVLPGANRVFFATQKLRDIIESAANPDIFASLYRKIGKTLNLVAYSVVLNKYYKYLVDMERYETISLTDKLGNTKSCRVSFNTDYINIYPNDNAIDITQEILDELLANINDISVWKKYFPDKSWTVEGFGIITLLDITLDEQINAFKAHLIESNHNVPVFGEIFFEDVLPFYGQIDIVASSHARNEAIKKDLIKQLEQSKEILDSRIKDKSFPFYEQLVFLIDKHLAMLREGFNTDSEQTVNTFFKTSVLPLLQHMSKDGAEDVTSFLDTLSSETNSLYEERKKFDTTVDSCNIALSAFLDKQQQKAQAIFPHYFEKFKTDGIEYNMYLGQSLVESGNYHEDMLYSLRLWQLQVCCEMEAMYHQIQKDAPIHLDVASLILVYNVPITIRYRMDEKRFDVDGAYNVRYEMIKKRIDKACIKNTNERLTQAHKLCIVYSDSEIEREYLGYINFLQAKNYLDDNVEIVELEELQGLSGLRAIRVGIKNTVLNC
ncbi:MAG: hypothetical protein ACK5IQ_05640 [Bacteroidales bacterium]